MSKNQIARLNDKVLTKPTVEETISQSEPQVQNTDLRPSHRDEALAATSTAKQRQPESSDSSQTSTSNRKQSDRFGEARKIILLKEDGGCDGFEETSRI